MSWLKLGLHSGYLTIATVALAGLQWAIVILVAHFDGPVPLGEYALAQAYGTPAFFFAALSIRQQYLVLPQERVSLADFLFLRVVAPAFVFGLLLGFIWATYVSTTFFWIAAGVFAMKYVEGLFDLASGKMQRAGDLSGVAITNVIRSMVSIPAFGAFYLVTHNLPSALLALSALWVAFFFVQGKRFNFKTSLSDVFDLAAGRLRHRLQIALHLIPFGTSFVVMSLGIQAPRFLLDTILGPKELGFFSAVCHFLTVGGIAAGAIGQALLPSLAKAIDKHTVRKFWEQLFWPSALIQIASLAGVMIAYSMGSEILGLIYGPEFSAQGHTLVMATIAAGPLFCSGIFANGCYAARIRSGLLAIQCVSLLVVVAATLILVPSLGIDGAFMGMMISAITQIVASVALLVWFFFRQEGLLLKMG